MAVQVTLNKSTDTLEFRPETPADNDVADYLCRLVKQAKAIVGSADPATVAKAGVGEIGLVRHAQEERLQVLKGIADREESRSRDWSLTWEIRQLANQRAYAAKEEARRISAELEGR